MRVGNLKAISTIFCGSGHMMPKHASTGIDFNGEK